LTKGSPCNSVNGLINVFLKCEAKRNRAKL